MVSYVWVHYETIFIVLTMNLQYLFHDTCKTLQAKQNTFDGTSYKHIPRKLILNSYFDNIGCLIGLIFYKHDMMLTHSVEFWE